MPFKKVIVIINPHSGAKKGLEYYRKFQEWYWNPINNNMLKKIGVQIDAFITSKTGRCNATALAQFATRESYDLIVVGGGDGTVKEVINGLRKPFIPLLIVRGGNGNDFGYGIGAVETIEEGIKLIFSGKLKEVDLFSVNGRLGANVFGVGGIDTRVVAYVELVLKKKCGLIPPQLLYVVSLLRELLRIKVKYPRLKLATKEGEAPSRAIEGEITALVIGNGPRCGGVFKLTPHADLSDGLLDICWIKKTGRLRILQNLFKAFKGTHLQMPEVITLDNALPRLRSFVISSDEFLSAEIDGEILPSAKSFVIKMESKVLKIVVP
jgi:diacylglycerol kinase (ATP)